MGNLGLSELLVIAIVALLVIGPRRLPEVARGLGEAFRAFQDVLHPVRVPKSGQGRTLDVGAHERLAGETSADPDRPPQEAE